MVPRPDITNHPWRITHKYGFGANLEQSFALNQTAFARFGWDNEKTESFAFTEVDQTLAGGLGADGAMWHRRYDRAGFAFVTNAICKNHRNYLAVGGYGFLLGDGALKYGREISSKLITQRTFGVAFTWHLGIQILFLPSNTYS